VAGKIAAKEISPVELTEDGQQCHLHPAEA